MYWKHRKSDDIQVIMRQSGLCVLSLFLMAGCESRETRFEIVSFKNAAQQDRFTEHFPTGSFNIDAQRDFTITFELEPSRGNGDPLTVVANDEPCQIVRIEIFWKPRPGTTYAESSQTDANLTYCLISGKQAITYEGAGFVYFSRSSDGKTMTGQIESGTLVPVHFVGEPIDLFGPCHLQGPFVAREDRRRVALAQQKLERCKRRELQTASP